MRVSMNRMLLWSITRKAKTSSEYNKKPVSFENGSFGYGYYLNFQDIYCANTFNPFKSITFIFFPCRSIRPDFLSSESKRIQLSVAVPTIFAISSRLNCRFKVPFSSTPRSEEHTSELQSRPHLVCRLLLEKKKN